MTTYADKFLPNRTPPRLFVTLIEANNEFLQCPAYGLLEVIETDAYGRVTRATFCNVSRKYPSEPAPPVLVERPVFIYSDDDWKPTVAPVTPQEVLNALRAVLGQIGPDMAAYSSIRYAYDLMERIDAEGIVGANGATL